jgi:hypothetical protein
VFSKGRKKKEDVLPKKKEKAIGIAEEENGRGEKNSDKYFLLTENIFFSRKEKQIFRCHPCFQNRRREKLFCLYQKNTKKVLQAMGALCIIVDESGRQ